MFDPSKCCQCGEDDRPVSRFSVGICNRDASPFSSQEHHWYGCRFCSDCMTLTNTDTAPVDPNRV